jgi:hypothetical protein
MVPTDLLSRAKQAVTCPAATHRPKRGRVLLGIFSTKDSFKSREQYRSLFEFWRSRDCRYRRAICSLSEFHEEIKQHNVSQCELIYSFVIGAGEPVNGVEAPTEIASDERPLLVNQSAMTQSWVEFDDLTLLNIRENTHQGKAQTWLRFASRVAEAHDIEYVAKCEQTASLDIPKYFRFADLRLLPQAYEWGLFAGALRDRTFWNVTPQGETREMIQLEKHMLNNYEGHFYMESKCTLRVAKLQLENYFVGISTAIWHCSLQMSSTS